jgi:quinol monooxygenase YgiN/catechol 2,3-dioxygenase-like lactoylglutathione lyase family enzyme
MITVTAIQRVKPGKEEALDALMRGLKADIEANEPGCQRFDYLCADGEPNSRLVYEQYSDQAAFEYHKTTGYLREFIPALLECLDEPPAVTTYDDAFTPRLTSSFFHIGIVVPDLARAAAHYSATLGVEFTEPAVFDIPRLEDPDPHAFKLTAVFSRTEPPYYELIQAEGDGIVSAAQAGKILYYAIWEPDMARRLERLKSEGTGIDALFRMDENSTPFAIITAPDPFGGRIEYVSTADVGPIQEWVRTGKYPGGIGA